MKPITIAGLVLIVVGILLFAVPRISFTTTETVVDVGPIEVEATERNTINIPDIAAGVAVAAGVILTIVGARQNGSG